MADAASTPTATTTDRSPTRGRRALVDVLVVLSAVLLMGAVVAGWMKLQLLDTDTWVDTSEQALDDPAVQSALATKLVDTAYEAGDPQQRLENALPPNLDPFAAPAAAALRPPAYDAAERALASEQLGGLWASVNRGAHERLLNVVEGDAPIVASTGEEITIDLRALVNQIATRIGVGPFEGNRIPADATTVSLPNSSGVAQGIEGLRVLDRLALGLALLAVATFAIALWLGRGMRRSAVTVWGVSLVLMGLILHVVINWARGMVPAELATTAAWQDAIRAIYDIATVQVALGANALILVGIFVLAGTWLLGMSRPATSLRTMSAPAMREHALLSWLGFGIVLFGLIQLVPAISSRTTEGLLLIIALAIVGFWALRRELLEMTPAVATTTGTMTTTGEPVTYTDRVARLDDLRARGVLDDDEYEAAMTAISSRDRREQTTEQPADTGSEVSS